MKHFAIRQAAMCALFFLTIQSASAQRSFWRAATGTPTHTAPASSYRTLRYDLSTLRAAVSRPDAAARGDGDATRTLSLPMPDGGELTVTVEPATVLEAGQQAANPSIQTFRGTTPDGGTLRLTVTDHGVWARVALADGRMVYIQPLTPANTAWSAVYFSEDADRGAARCGVEGGATIDEDAPAGKTAAYSYTDATLRNYELSVAATGEYTVANGGQAGALAAITATVNNVTLIFERDLGVTFTLYSPNSILFTDPNTDPYTTTLDATALTTNHSTLDAQVGSANYDLGHLFSTAFGGGLAYGSIVCNNTIKGGGASGTVNASQASFEEIVAHEFGHQFSASHTFSATTGGCSGNGFYPAGYEPGSGTSIMSYADLCSPLNVPGGKGRFFHAGSLQQMGSFILNASTGGSCASNSQPLNPAPTLATATAITIPNGTPFYLTSTGADANNPSTLTYTYDQLDPIGGSGTATAPASTDVSGPMFRSYVPAASPVRYFPPLAALFAGTSTSYEVLPTVARALNFRATVRDNNPGFGRTQTESVVVTTASCGPFAITSQNTATTLTADGTATMTVTWNTASCVTCPDVTLRITRDGGATYTTLLASTPNDGTETFLVPNVPACDARLMLECATAPFFDVTSTPLTITSSCAADGATISPVSTLSVPAAGDAALAQTITPGHGTALPSPITGTVTNADPLTTLAVPNTTAANACINFSNATYYEAYTFQPGTTGTYTFTANAAWIYNIYEGAFNPSQPCSGLLASSGYFDGTFYYTGTTVSAALCRDKTYTYVVGIPAAAPNVSYSVSVTGGTLYSGGTPAPGAGYTYEYAIVNAASGNIVAIQVTPDMTNSTLFPDGQYTVYGLSRSTSTSAAAYVGGSFATFQSAVLGQSGGLCASLSANSRTVLINAAPLAGLDVRLAAALTNRRTARATWTVQGSEAGVARYELQRSYDGRLFSTAATTTPGTGAQHAATDAGLREEAAGVHYRVAIQTAAGAPRYTATTYLPFSTGAAGPALAVAPNPVQGATLRAAVTSANAGTGTAVVLDAAGRALLRVPVSLSIGAQQLELPTGGLAAGVYLLRVEGAGAPLQVRFCEE